VLFGATSVEELLDLPAVAESSGAFGSVWVGDGLIAKARLESIVTLSAIAARTRTVKLGVCCMATFPLRNPVLFAIQWASLDVLSAGRSLLAVCLGATTSRSGVRPESELDAMGVAANERISRFVEGIEVVRKVWSGTASHEGKHYRFDEIDVLPKPVQDPCPIWIASNPDPRKLSADAYERAIRRVARLADGWQSTVITPEEFGARLRDIRAAANDVGRDPDRLPSAAHLMVNLQDDRGTAREQAKRFLDSYYVMDVQPDTMDAWGAYGTPSEVADRINEYIVAGLDLPIIRFASHDQRGQLDRGISELLPQLDGHG
jgi:alkanesulfonate monooxygenase SsuD/methylene tetrahydromethanopterin reductase-like flavin-dependent oxidoreductase (luciferase family)